MRIGDHILAARLKALELEQRERYRPAPGLQIELDEVAAVRKLARSCFGDLTSIHVDQTEPGVFQVGYFTGPPVEGIKGDGRRKRRVIFKARSARELDEQIAVWREHRG